MSTMQWTIEETPDRGHLVQISGFITEEADFQTLAALQGPAALRLDLAGVEQINSCGVREWIHFVRRIAQAQRPLELLRCSPAIVRQLNTISNFRGNGKVRSVMLPYFCPDCEREEHRLHEIPTTVQLQHIEDVLPCPVCGADMEFDDLPDTYLAFAA